MEQSSSRLVKIVIYESFCGSIRTSPFVQYFCSLVQIFNVIAHVSFYNNLSFASFSLKIETISTAIQGGKISLFYSGSASSNGRKGEIATNISGIYTRLWYVIKQNISLAIRCRIQSPKNVNRILACYLHSFYYFIPIDPAATTRHSLYGGGRKNYIFLKSHSANSCSVDRNN